MIQLHISKLTPSVSEDSLLELLSRAGTVDSVEVIRDLQTGESQGYAIARMADEQAADEAINRLNDFVFAGNPLKISRMHLTMPGEMTFRDWLHNHAGDVLSIIGMK